MAVAMIIGVHQNETRRGEEKMNKEEEKKMDIEEEKKMDIEELCKEELAWAEEVYSGDPSNPWLEGYRNALYRNTLRTVLRSVNRRGEEKMNKEERENVQVVTRRLVKASLELRYVISALPEGEDVKRLMKGNALIEDGLGVILLSLEVQ